MDLIPVSETLFNALSISSILILTALGLSITFGVMKVINMAHGEMLMLGAYTAYLVEDKNAISIAVRNWGRILSGLSRFVGLDPDSIGFTRWETNFGLQLNLYWAIGFSFILVGIVGYLLEVCLVRFLYGRPLDTLLATWGFGIIIQQLVNLTFGPQLPPIHVPEALQGNWPLGGVAIPIFRVFTIGITALCLLAVYLWFFRTSFGLKIRAVVQNRQMASALGISTRRIDSLTFAFASGLAGVAGCILAHQYNAKYNMGGEYIVKAFMVVILGGMGQMWGVVAGGATIGISESVLAKLLGSEWLKDAAGKLDISSEDWNRIIGSNSDTLPLIFVLLLVIGFIMIRPSGLFATKERSYE